jgi:hypothetical protein
MVERNCFDFKYMEGLTHHAGRIDALSRRRIFKSWNKD